MRGLKWDCPAGSQTSWSGVQVRLKLDRADRGDCSLKAKILHTAFPVPSMATSCRLPHPEDIPDESSLLSCVSASGLPQTALVILLCRFPQPLLLRLQVSASRSLPRGKPPPG